MREEEVVEIIFNRQVTITNETLKKLGLRYSIEELRQNLFLHFGIPHTEIKGRGKENPFGLRILPGSRIRKRKSLAEKMVERLKPFGSNPEIRRVSDHKRKKGGCRRPIR